MPISVIHARLANAALMFSLICFAWGLLNYVLKKPVTSSYWGGLAILEILMIAQSVLGVVMLVGGVGQLLRPIVHVLYGITTIISLPAVYVYTGGKDTRRENLLYALVCLWLAAIAERGITTGIETVLPGR